jgi:hypothetical protein
MEFSQKELMGSLSGTKIFKFPSLSLVDLLTAAEKMEHKQAAILEEPVRLAYQPPASSTFLSQQTSHQQPASSTFLSEQTSISHQPSAKRTGFMQPALEPNRDRMSVMLSNGARDCDIEIRSLNKIDSLLNMY